MRCTILFFILICSLFACKPASPPKQPGDADLTLEEFFGFFPGLNFTFTIDDALLKEKEKDSLKFSNEAIRRLLGDTVFVDWFGKSKTVKLYPVGSGTDKDGGLYLLIKSVVSRTARCHILYFNQKRKLIAGKEIASTVHDRNIDKYCKIDKRFIITIVEERNVRGGETIVKQNVYYLNKEGEFRLIMTDSNEDLSSRILANPIDSLPRKSTYSADYAIDKNNLVSIRDGISPNTFRFYIHFSKQKGDCNGELKGEGELSGSTGSFIDDDGPCTLKFVFSKSAVQLSEVGGCGSYRDLTCYFEGRFIKKVEKKIPLKKRKS